MRSQSTGRSGEAPPAPEPLAVAVLDSHTHLDLQDGIDQPGGVDEALAEARAVGVDRVVQVGIDVPSSHWAAELAANHPAIVATVALHPNEAPRLSDLDGALAEIDKLAALERVRGIGETGLDYFRTDEAGRAQQHASFRAHIDIAKRHGKALVIHDRDAHDDVLKLLEEEGAPETVAPFLTPMPYRGRPNAPYLIPLTVRFLADLRGDDLDELCAVISATGERVFGPW